MDYQDYYRILGVPRDADEQTIKSAFRRLARVYHPDVADDKTTATERFKELSEAYAVLSDPEKRRTYDLFSSRYQQYQRTYSGAHTTGSPFGASSSARTSARGGSADSAGTRTSATGSQPSGGSSQGPRPSQAGAQPGAGGSGSAGSRAQGPRRTSTRTMSEEDLERILRGFAWAYTAASSRGARGSSSSDFSDFFDALFGNQGAATGQGTGQTPTDTRPGRDIEAAAEITLEEAYQGAVRTVDYKDGRRVEVSIPPGVSSGTRLRVRGQGERLLGRAIGDLYLTLHVLPHPVFNREGDDLHVRVAVPYETATRSGEVEVPTLDRPVKLRIPAGTQTNQAFRMRGLGMPKVQSPAARGDLIASVTVQAPAAADSQPEQARPARSAPPARQPGSRLAASRWLIGLALIAASVIGVMAQVLTGDAAGWLLAGGAAVTLLLIGLLRRSAGVAVLGSLALLATVLWAVQTYPQAADAVQVFWPLLPWSAGLGLLALPGRR